MKVRIFLFLLLQLMLTDILSLNLTAQEHEHEIVKETAIEAEILVLIERQFPEYLAELESLRKSAPREYEFELRHLREPVARYKKMKGQHPELADRIFRANILERKSLKLARQVKHTKDQTKRKQLLNELSAVLKDIFDIRIAVRKAEAETLSQEVAKVFNTIRERERNREAIIGRRLKDLVSEEEDPLRW